jgi:hypothetical protein
MCYLFKETTNNTQFKRTLELVFDFTTLVSIFPAQT